MDKILIAVEDGASHYHRHALGAVVQSVNQLTSSKPTYEVLIISVIAYPTRNYEEKNHSNFSFLNDSFVIS
jgi:hypothetical protein